MANASASAPKPGDGLALLIIDMISNWQFKDADRLLPAAHGVAPAIARLKHRCQAQGLPVIYANDNLGQWRSDFRQLVDEALVGPPLGAALTQQLLPGPDDYFVLKPKHSAFFATPLELLLQRLQVGRLIVTGVASDQCILTTAAEARMNDYGVMVPSDCVATQTKERNQRAIRHFDEVIKVRTTPAARLRLD